MTARIRKIISFVETVERVFDHALPSPATRVCAAAVIENPCAGRYVEDLCELMTIGAEMGQLLAEKCLEVSGLDASSIQSFGKAALVGENGEIEHGAALLHPSLGAPLRQVIGGGKALVPSSKKIGGPGDTLDVPLGHKDAAYVRSHFDGMPIRIADAPRPNEILIAIALAPCGRPAPRVGGLTHDEIIGDDGLK